jgi:hypothetical protein
MTTRGMIFGSVAGGCLSLLGYGTEAALRGRATEGTYILMGCGLLGLALIWLNVRRLSKHTRT